jgi:ferredoxin
VKLVVNWSLCDGNGVCAKEAPELLQMDDQDFLIVRSYAVTEDLRRKMEAAVRACPKRALSIVPD